jgi:hypothetical protein
MSRKCFYKIERPAVSHLTSRILDLSREYVWIGAVHAVALAVLVSLTVVGKTDIQADWPLWAQHLASAAIGAVIALSATRMAYVVWRDYDIVKLQKQLIDAAAARVVEDGEVRTSDAKVAHMRGSGLRKISVAAPKGWQD